MKQQVFHLHGGESYTNYDDFIKRLKTKDIWDLPTEERKTKWTSTFPDDLGPEYEVFMPAMPNKNNAKYEEWKIWFERHFKYLHDNVILIGFSLGSMFLAKYLSENEIPIKVKALYLMATPYTDHTYTDHDSGEFVFSVADLHLIADRVDKVFILHSRDDFLVPFEHSEKLQMAIPNSQLIAFEEKNHFLVEELPELVAHIKAL